MSPELQDRVHEALREKSEPDRVRPHPDDMWKLPEPEPQLPPPTPRPAAPAPARTGAPSKLFPQRRETEAVSYLHLDVAVEIIVEAAKDAIARLCASYDKKIDALEGRIREMEEELTRP